MPAATADDPAAARADRRTLLLAAGTVMSVFAVGAAAQTAWVYGNQGGSVPVLLRIAANLTAVVGMLVLLVVVGVARPRRPTTLVVLGVLAAGVAAAGVRFGVQVTLGIYPHPARSVVLAEVVSGAVVAWIAGFMGLAAMLSQRRLRTQVAAAAESRLQIELALQALQYEEVRVRREVAEGLHGSMQQRLVLVVARLDRLRDRLSGRAEPEDLELLGEVREQIELVRETDVRSTSRMLYPDQLEVGMVPAVRALLGRIPTTVNTRFGVADEVRVLDDPADPRLTRSERLLAVRVVEEGVTNALRHGHAAVVDVRVAVVGDALEVRVADDGVGFVPGSVPASGTARLGDRLRLAGGDLRVTSVPGNGTQVVARLPVESLRTAAR
ncbi:ATP-binding protein [Cellulomonas sp. ES6]|uniref:sensor histidine kinase n=1 Tax=Cellulomonas sp. ES6 TaxID=3039384 RepID=UPI0019CB7F65|nr:ATP-binding protein [Cellulomonas sp. ES6]MBD3778515.1 ATP-binding protein [Micrococcales bacterium]WHP19075.1 ATP-binding protein [Cellulomonas sp. ES6]